MIRWFLDLYNDDERFVSYVSCGGMVISTLAFIGGMIVAFLILQRG